MSNKKPLTFGLLIMNVVEPHITGSIYAADRLGVNLVVFPGQIIQSQDKYYAQENIIYEFITKERIDGLIIDIGGLNWYITREEMMSFIDRYKPIPIITMGASFEGIPSILLDDFIGMKRAVDHLIEVHGFKRIAFLRGSEGHHAECERYRGYEESLKEHGIDVEDELVSPVNITWNNLESIKILFDERKVNC